MGMKRFLALGGIAVAVFSLSALPVTSARADTQSPAPTASSSTNQPLQQPGEDGNNGEGHERGIRIDRDFGRSEPIQFIVLGAALTAALVIAYGIGRRHRKSNSATPQ